MKDLDKTNGKTLLARMRDAEEDLAAAFWKEPESFFTEHDLVARFYHLASRRLGGCSRLLHCEYPTPFKCSMAGSTFSHEDDGSRFHRGHYDLVVLDPDFVCEHECDLDLLTGQDWKATREFLQTGRFRQVAVMLYELMLVHRKVNGDGTVSDIAEHVGQDWKKLLAALRPMGTPSVPFAAVVRMLVFDGAMEQHWSEKLKAAIDVGVGPIRANAEMRFVPRARQEK